jgi:hypothetical protein
MVFIFAATALFGFHLFHAAIATGTRFFYGKVPVGEPAHAVMQVYRSAYRGAEVKDSYYEYQELFHNGVKVAGFFGKRFIKFRGSVIEYVGRHCLTIYKTYIFNILGRSKR